MKKILVSILIIIVSAGSFTPCCSIDECIADQVTNGEHNKNKTEGSCSPFFACASCPASVELTGPAPLDFSIIEKIVHHQSIVKSTLTSYSTSFWQPPRSC